VVLRTFIRVHANFEADKESPRDVREIAKQRNPAGAKAPARQGVGVLEDQITIGRSGSQLQKTTGAAGEARNQ
jgi:hypothetical protein